LPKKAVQLIQSSTPLRPSIALVLGSGFQALARTVSDAVEIPYTRIPGFLPTRVDGHEGKVMIGHLNAVPVIVLSGRAHYYEGHSLAELTVPIRVLAACGVRTLILTNAAGGINPHYRRGDFMGVTDHLNFMGANPLRGLVRTKQSCFVDLSETYDPSLVKLLVKAARQTRVRLHLGVYAAVPGPCYETPAEVRAFGRLGADAVGMSTVPEAIVARQCGLRVAAVSCITNPAAGLSRHPISHAEVLATGEKVKAQAVALLNAFVSLLGVGLT
jgi:purine-nucleoside phosphorylase